MKLKCLRTLDISLNDIESLPVNLCHLRALETLVFDIEKIKYPSQGELDFLCCFKFSVNLLVLFLGECFEQMDSQTRQHATPVELQSVVERLIDSYEFRITRV